MIHRLLEVVIERRRGRQAFLAVARAYTPIDHLNGPIDTGADQPG